MKKFRLILALLAAGVILTSLTDKKLYQLFSGEGRKLEYSDLVEEALKADVILFGEEHDNPVSHWLQRELTLSLHEKMGKELILGAEMFETDDQLVLDEYLARRITEKTFREEIRFWPNYMTDYRPVLELCREKGLPFIGTNVPRRYANLVYSKGLKTLDSLDKSAQQYLPPLPFPYDETLRGYREIFEAAGGHGGQNLPQSQALKDATMAHNILRHWTKGKKFLHLNGTYHSNYKEGIAWYLKKWKPELKVFTIATVTQASADTLSRKQFGIADLVICVNENITRTH